MRVYLWIAVVLSLSACKEAHQPCSGKKFDVLVVPLTFGIEHADVLLGKVTIDVEHKITFAPEDGVDPEELAKLRQDLDVHMKADAANYEFSDRGPDGTHYSCGGAVKKGTPEYPAAMKAALYSDYYEVVDTP